MSIWQKNTIEDKKALIQFTADKENINQVAVEKDWWVTVVLKTLFQTSCAESLLFKGGTSLSKGWDSIIERFSEDIDLAIDHSFFNVNETSKSQKEKLRKQARKYVHETLSKELGEQLDAMGIVGYSIENITTIQTANGEKAIDSDKDPTVIHLNYESILDSKVEYIPSRVKIEISCLSMAEPCELKEITSLIYSHYPEEDDDTRSNIKTVLPTRTFLEKIFLLHEEFQKDTPRHLRMSRHLYDLERLMDTNFGKEALSDTHLYAEIVKHRSLYYTLKYIDYQKHHPSTINFCPPEKNRKDWDRDYEEMKNSFIYADNKLSFDELIARIEELQSRFRQLEIRQNFLE